MLFSRRQFFGGWAGLLAAVPLVSQALSGTAAATASSPQDSTNAFLVLANHILVDQDVLDGYGHVSAREPRNPNRFLLARSMPPAMVEESDLMTFDLDGKQVGKDTRPSHVDRFIHSEIYRARPDVKAIVYCQTPELITFGTTDVPLRPLSHMCSFVSSGVPVFDVRKFRAPGDKSMLIHDATLGRGLADVLGNHSAVLMRGYGGVIVGASIPQVVGRCVYLKIDAATLATTLGLNRPVNYLDSEEGLDPALSGFDRMWDVWVDEQEDKDTAKETTPRRS